MGVDIYAMMSGAQVDLKVAGYDGSESLLKMVVVIMKDARV